MLLFSREYVGRSKDGDGASNSIMTPRRERNIQLLRRYRTTYLSSSRGEHSQDEGSGGVTIECVRLGSCMVSYGMVVAVGQMMMMPEPETVCPPVGARGKLIVSFPSPEEIICCWATRSRIEKALSTTTYVTSKKHPSSEGTHPPTLFLCSLQVLNIIYFIKIIFSRQTTK